MKRRSFGLLAGSSVVALQASVQGAHAQSAAPDDLQLGTTLTPLGGEKAGNADGSIPAWTGGATILPAGVGPDDYMPDMFADERPVLVIDSSNIVQYAHMLSDGVVAMMGKYQDFRINVFPTHRTAAAPQWVYDNTKANVASTKFSDRDPIGGRFGFEGAYGGIPFPIPDQSNPLTAGAQIIWNYNACWLGKANTKRISSWSVTDGQLSEAFGSHEVYRYPYYIAKSLEEYNGKYQQLLFQLASPYTAPPNLVGQNIIVWSFSNPYEHPQEAWELLNGQGRVRRAPEVAFDTPMAQSNGIADDDEYYGFSGSLERYDWKLLGKQEMYIPYNCNALSAASPQEAHLTHFVNPDLVRWEKHRCWVVEATVHPGERNTLARRKFYVDEDTWIPGLVDAWDANNTLFKVSYIYNIVQPGLPGTIYGNNAIHNLQMDNYVTVSGQWNCDPLIWADDLPESLFDPANMAASAQY